MKIRLELDDEIVNLSLRFRERLLVGLILALINIVGGIKYTHQLDELTAFLLNKGE